MPLEGLLRAAPILLATMQAKVVAYLAKNPNRWVPISEVAAHAYAEREDGGPIDAAGILRTVVHRNRARLATLGWEVVGKPTGGWRLVVCKKFAEAG